MLCCCFTDVLLLLYLPDAERFSSDLALQLFHAAFGLAQHRLYVLQRLCVVCVCVFEGEKGRERESERLNRDDRREMHMNSDCTWTSAEGRKAETDRQRGKIGEGSGQGRQIRKR